MDCHQREPVEVPVVKCSIARQHPRAIPISFNLPKDKMFDKSGQWVHLETFDDFDNGLSELIDLWSSTASQNVKESALAHFKEDLDAAVLTWIDNRAKSKKYAAIGKELAEFEEALR